MLSERLMVERRWAMEMVVLLPLRRALRAWLTRVSDSASRAEVAVSSGQYMVRVEAREGGKENGDLPSSRIRISGFLTRALAIAMRCF